VADRLLPQLPPENLAICRIVTGLWILIVAFRSGRGFYRACTRSPIDQFRPVGVLRWMSEPFDPTLFGVIVVLLLVVSVAFVVGLAHRVTGPLFGLLVLVVFTYRNSWGFIFHTDNSLVFAALVLGLTPAADAWSVDAWRGRRMVATDPPDASGDRRDYRYGWPIQLMILCACVAYCVAGWSKIGAEGLSWADGGTLRGQVLRNAFWYEFIAGKAPAPTLSVLAWPVGVFRALSIVSLALELGAPLALLDRRLTLAFALAMFGFHWGVMFTMGIPFAYHLAGFAFVAFVPWDWIIDAIRQRRAKSASGH